MDKKTIYIFHGDDAFLIEESVQTIQKKHPELSVEVFPEKGDLDQLRMKVSSGGLFSSTLLILAKNPGFLTQSVSDSEFECIKDICNYVQEQGHILILYSPGKAFDQRKKTVQFFKKVGTLSKLDGFQAWEQEKVYQWIQSRLKDNHKTIDREAVAALEEMAGTQLSLLAQHCETLLSYIGNATHVTLNDVRALSGEISKSTFDFNDALKMKNPTKLLQACKSLLSNGEDPFKLMGLALSNIRLYLKILLLQKDNQTEASMAKTLKKNPYYLKRLVPTIRSHHTIEGLQSTLAYFHDQDIAIKSGQRHAQHALNLSLIQFCNN